MKVLASGGLGLPLDAGGGQGSARAEWESGLPILPVIPPTGSEVPCVTEACSACCHDIEMILTEADLERLQAARPGEDFWFEADDGYLQLRTREGPAARGGQGRPCWFLGANGLCSVHAVRPEGCRLYPAVWDEGLREAALDEDYCPHTDGFRLPDGADGAVQQLAARLEQERRVRRHASAK